MENMLPPDHIVFQDACRAFGKLTADADIWANITQTQEGVGEVADSIVAIIGGGTVFSPETTSLLRQAAFEGYCERLQFLKSFSDRIGRG